MLLSFDLLPPSLAPAGNTTDPAELARLRSLIVELQANGNHLRERLAQADDDTFDLRSQLLLAEAETAKSQSRVPPGKAPRGGRHGGDGDSNGVGDGDADRAAELHQTKIQLEFKEGELRRADQDRLQLQTELQDAKVRVRRVVWGEGGVRVGRGWGEGDARGAIEEQV